MLASSISASRFALPPRPRREIDQHIVSRSRAEAARTDKRAGRRYFAVLNVELDADCPDTSRAERAHDGRSEMAKEDGPEARGRSVSSTPSADKACHGRPSREWKIGKGQRAVVSRTSCASLKLEN